MIRHRFSNFPSAFCLFFLLACSIANITRAQTIPSPKSVLGFEPTQDKTIADWSQIVNYFQKLDAASSKIIVKEIGKTTLGRPFIVAFVSSAENIKNLEKYKNEVIE